MEIKSNKVPKAFLEGLKGYYSKQRNPYPIGTLNHNDFTRGYNYEKEVHEIVMYEMFSNKGR